jgi:hypothetical protein
MHSSCAIHESLIVALELFHHRIKSQDLSSPGPKTENDIEGMAACRPTHEQPEFDLASPLALPPSPTSFQDCDDSAADARASSNQDDARIDPFQSKASPPTKLRSRKVKHGGIYSLLLKGLKRPDDNDSAVLVEPAKECTTHNPPFRGLF